MSENSPHIFPMCMWPPNCAFQETVTVTTPSNPSFSDSGQILSAMLQF